MTTDLKENKTKKISGTLLFISLMLLELVALAEPCITPGDPVGCEIDTPLDGQAWALVAAVLVLTRRKWRASWLG